MAGAAKGGVAVVEERGGNLPVASSPMSATVGLASSLVLAANVYRKSLRMINTSSNRISLAFDTPAVLDSGLTLFPAGVFNMDEYDYNRGDIFAIASAAGSNLAIQEYV